MANSPPREFESIDESTGGRRNIPAPPLLNLKNVIRGHFLREKQVV